MKKPKRKIYRDAVTGKIVTRKYALANPETTVCETIVVPETKKEIQERVEREEKKQD